MLTAKQEAFARCVALDGMSYADAYREAYNTSNMASDTIHVKASLLKDKDNVRARIAELRSEIESPKIMTAQKRAERLTELADHGDPCVAMRAIDLLNKMTGEYVQRVEADVKAQTIVVELVDDGD